MSFDPVTLRPCNVQDGHALALVGAATFLESFAGVLEGAAIVAHCARHHSIETYTRYLAMPECKAWLAVAPKGAPVGYVMLTPPDLPLDPIAPGDIELKRIYLFSRFHGSGIGQRLLDQALSVAQECGKTRILLGVFAGNQRALAFYRRNGFTEVGTRTFQVGNMLCDDLILARALEPA